MNQYQGEYHLTPSSITERDLKERCTALAQLVRDYDTYLHDIMPYAYTYWMEPSQLRTRAREEGIDIQEPLP